MDQFGLGFATSWLMRFGIGKLASALTGGLRYAPNLTGKATAPESALHDGFKLESVPVPLDAIVIGSGIGGMVISAILAKKGKRVLVLEQHVTAGGCLAPYSIDHNEVDVGYHFVGMLFPESSKVTKDFLYPLLDWLSDGKLAWRKLDAVDTVHLLDRGEKFEIRLGDGWKHVKRMLKERFPDESRGIDSVFDLYEKGETAFRSSIGTKASPPRIRRSLGPRIFPCDAESMALWEKTGKEILDEHLQDPVLKTLISQFHGGFSMTLSQMPFPALSVLHESLAHGLYYPIGGTGNIIGHLIDTVKSAGGRVLTQADVTRIILRDGRVSGVELRARDETFEVHAPLIISDIGLRETYTHLLPGFMEEHPEIGIFLDATPPSDSHIMVNVVLDGTGKNLGLHQGEVWIVPNVDRDAQKDLFNSDPEQMPSYMFVVFPSTRNLERYGDTNTSMMSLISIMPYKMVERWAKDYEKPHKGPIDYNEFKEKLGNRLLESFLSLDEWGHLKKHVKKVSISSPLTQSYFLSREEGSTCGLMHTRDRFFHPLAGPYTPIQGLYLTGADAACSGVPGAGLGGFLTSVAINAEDISGPLRTLMCSALERKV